MAPKAVDARKCFDRNHRSRGHGPLLQKVSSCSTAGGASSAVQEEPMAPKAVDARKCFNRNHRSRGHGPLLQKASSSSTAGGASSAV
jgi:hypothetical protein